MDQCLEVAGKICLRAYYRLYRTLKQLRVGFRHFLRSYKSKITSEFYSLTNQVSYFKSYTYYLKLFFSLNQI